MLDNCFVAITRKSNIRLKNCVFLGQFHKSRKIVFTFFHLTEYCSWLLFVSKERCIKSESSRGDQNSTRSLTKAE